MEATVATRAAEIMSSPVVTASPSTSVADIATLLGRHRISAVPVVDDGGHVVGLVSEYDLLAKSGPTAAEVMTTAVVSVTGDTLITDVRQLLIEQRIRRLPVLQDGRLAGIVSRGDVVALLATEWVCGVCGEPFRGERPPDNCPKCHAGSDRFHFQEQLPGP
ncbi:MAG TPA: CBS domain-containing protein [Arthrobacter sp.]|nr:CBS domain-containing protein [Arthrobacter sp.]